LRLDDRLRELSFGSRDGLRRSEIAALQPGTFDGESSHEWYFATPDGETYEVFAGRVAAWLAEAGDGPLIVVTHGVVTRVLRGLYAACRAPSLCGCRSRRTASSASPTATIDEIAVP